MSRTFKIRTNLRRHAALLLTLGLFVGMPTTLAAKEKLKHTANGVSKRQSMVGLASFYAAKFHGRRTASGEIFNTHALTAAHLTLPFGTKVKVTNLRNGKSVIVRINDRGPHVRGRIIDLSVAAAKKIGLNRAGTVRVKLEILGK